MKDSLRHLAYEIELLPGEKLTLPTALLDAVGAGRWIITVALAEDTGTPIRTHDALLNGYSDEDEGFYDDCASRRDLTRDHSLHKRQSFPDSPMKDSRLRAAAAKPLFRKAT